MSTNPFDDGDSPSLAPSYQRHGSTTPGRREKCTNPFGDDVDNVDESAPMAFNNAFGTRPFDSSGVLKKSDDRRRPSISPSAMGASSRMDGSGEAENSLVSPEATRLAFLGPNETLFETISSGPESSWQDLGDLPYRRVRMYSNVVWGRRVKHQYSDVRNAKSSSPTGASRQRPADAESSKDKDEEQFGLSFYPKSYVETVQAHQHVTPGTRAGIGDLEVERLLSTTTSTLVAGCPNGGPIAAVTIPLSSGGASGYRNEGGAGSSVSNSRFGVKTNIRIMNNSGAILSTISFPPRDLSMTIKSPVPPAARNAPTEDLVMETKRVRLHRTPGDILTIGFTSRCVLIVVLRDSLTLCYDLSGKPLLPPFFALHGPKAGPGGNNHEPEINLATGVDLLEACVFEGGVAVLGCDMNSAVVELLDEHDDPSYADSADISSRCIVPTLPSESMQETDARNQQTEPVFETSASPSYFALPPYYALVTPLPTAMLARSKRISYQCLAVLPRQYASSRRPELFLSTSDGSVVVSELHPSTSPNSGLTDVDCRSKIGGSGMGTIAPIVAMSFAPNGRFLACFTSNSILTVVSTTFESTVLEFDTSSGSSSPPRSMGWCGEDSVVLHWKNLGVLMVGPYGDWLRFPYSRDDCINTIPSSGHGSGVSSTSGVVSNNELEVFLVPEMDCCRVITSTSVEILQRVPPGTADLLRIGSIEPGALLLDASDAFDAGNSNADEAARSITQREGLLEEAIRGCVEAALGEFDIKVQKRMLRAASYGLHFSCKDSNYRVRASGRPSHEAVNFIKASKKLRVLNSLRRQATGFTMSSAQYDDATPKGVVARLMAAGRPALASSISEYLKLGRRVRDYARVMKAASFVASCSSIGDIDDKGVPGLTDSQIAEEAVRIIRGEKSSQGKISDRDNNTSISSPLSGMYASVALAAHRAGRRGVSDLLILLERSPVDKVNALLATGSYSDAASVAVRSRDPDLIYNTMSAYERRVSGGDEGKFSYFAGVINKYPMEAVNILTSYYARIGGLPGGDLKPLISILLRRQRHNEAGSKIAKKALLLGHHKTASFGGNEIEKAKVEALTESSRVFGLGGKDCAFQKSCTDEQIDLLADQQQLRSFYGSAEVAPPSSSVTSTIISILKYGATNPRQSHRIFTDADKIAKKYKVPEKRIWHIKVRAFSESAQWAVLRNLADSRSKPPIGFKPFVLAAIKGGQGETEILRYINRMQGQSEGEECFDLFCEAGLWKQALEEAVKAGDDRKIAHVRSICNSPAVQRLCDGHMSSSRGK